MSLANQVLAVNDDLPIRTHKPVHSGKVRSVYWLTEEDSARLIKEKGYNVAPDAPLAIMVISDRISAFDCIWHAEGGLNGVPGKGAALNAISNHWFKLFKENGLADSHILDIPHPFVWIVQKAKPVKIEAICRKYITGSMWRAYANGEREFCGIQLPEGFPSPLGYVNQQFVTYRKAPAEASRRFLSKPSGRPEGFALKTFRGADTLALGTITRSREKSPH